MINDGITKLNNLNKKVSDDQLNKMVDAVNLFRKMPTDKLSSEEFDKIFTGSGITLTNNEIKDIIKEISSLENTEIKETTRIITNQKEGFLNFLNSLLEKGLLLKKV